MSHHILPAPVSTKRGFLPEYDPVTAFPESSELSLLDELGRTLPDHLENEDFREHIRPMHIPLWTEQGLSNNLLPYMRLYYVRLGFLASGYVNQVGKSAANELPENIARPLCDICQRLNRPPILSYDGYALYNWHRLDVKGPVELGNIDTLQNFVRLYDEHWFILVHVDIEAKAATTIKEITKFPLYLANKNQEAINKGLTIIADSIRQQEKVLRRIPEKMDPALYYKTFRPYIRFFENVHYKGVDVANMHYRGETGAQSSIMPALVAFMKIPHQPSVLTNHLADMRNYMPKLHRELIEWIEKLPDFKSMASAETFNKVLETMADFRKVHYGWAEEYINKHTDDPRGTGGTPYMQWLKQLIDETLEHRK